MKKCHVVSRNSRNGHEEVESEEMPEASVNAEDSDETLCSSPVPLFPVDTFRRRQNVFAIGLVMMLVMLYLDSGCSTHYLEKVSRSEMLS